VDTHINVDLHSRLFITSVIREDVKQHNVECHTKKVLIIYLISTFYVVITALLRGVGNTTEFIEQMSTSVASQTIF